jgi:hypothetical protein
VVPGEAGYCFFKDKILPTSLKKRKDVNLFWQGAMEVPVEGISLIYYDKGFIEILAPCIVRKRYFKFFLLKILSSLAGLRIAIIIRARHLSNNFFVFP